MVELYENKTLRQPPNTFSYAFLLNACAYTTTGTKEQKLRAFNIGKGAFKKILEMNENVTQIHFANFLLSCSNLLPPSENRDKLMTSVFDECQKRGLVDVQVILNIRRSLSPHQKEEALRGTNLGRGRILFDDLPYEWRCNAKGRVKSSF